LHFSYFAEGEDMSELVQVVKIEKRIFTTRGVVTGSAI
jgi:hypothetical protein